MNTVGDNVPAPGLDLGVLRLQLAVRVVLQPVISSNTDRLNIYFIFSISPNPTRQQLFYERRHHLIIILKVKDAQRSIKNVLFYIFFKTLYC